MSSNNTIKNLIRINRNKDFLLLKLFRRSLRSTNSSFLKTSPILPLSNPSALTEKTININLFPDSSTVVKTHPLILSEGE